MIFVRDLLLFILSMLLVVPQFTVNSNANYLMIALVILWFTFDFAIRVKLYGGLKISKYELIFALSIAVICIASYSTGNAVVANRYLSTYVFFLYFIAFTRREKSGQVFVKWYQISILIVVALFSLITLNELNINSYVSREIDPNSYQMLENASRGIGGYSLIYVCAFAVYILYAQIKIVKHRGGRVFIIAAPLYLLLGLFAVLVVKSNYLTATLLMIFGIIAISSSKIVSKIPYVDLVKFFSIAIIVLFASILTGAFKIIADIMAELLNGSLTSERINAITTFIYANGSLDDLTAARMSTRDASINTILDNPMMGIIWNNYSFINDEYQSVGQHSLILDSFALFGVLIGGVIVYLLLYPFYFINRKTRSAFAKNLSVVVGGAILVFMYINNVVPAIGIFVYYGLGVVVDMQRQVINMQDNYA